MREFSHNFQFSILTNDPEYGRPSRRDPQERNRNDNETNIKLLLSNHKLLENKRLIWWEFTDDIKSENKENDGE